LFQFFLILLLSFGSYAQDQDLLQLESQIDNSDDLEISEKQTKSGLTKKNSQERDYVGRNIDLKSILEEGLRRNPFEQIRAQQKEQIDLYKTDLFQSFWLPKLSLELNSGEHRIDRLKTSSKSTSDMGAQVAPTGSLGFVIKDYTLFNWGRDYLQYESNKQTLNRELQRLKEAKRRLKFSIIGSYFNLIKARQIKNIKKEQLRQMSFVHRTAREKLKLKKIRAQDYYQTRSEFLRSQTEYQQALFELGLQEENLANTLGDDYQGGYRTEEQLSYKRVSTNLDEALKLAQEQSVDYRDAKLNYENAQRNLDKTLKDNLPLPKLSLNLGSYRTGFDPQGTSWTYQTTNGNRNVELVAGINMTWTILGEGGFFNSRVNQQAYLAKRITEISFYNTRRQLDVKLRTIYKTLKYLEQKVEIATFQHKNAQSNYDTVLDNYLADRASYADLKLAIDNLVNSHVNSEIVKFDHLQKKLELSDFMGLEDLPGENFENLAQR